MNAITKYAVRRPGCATVSFHRSERAAHKAAKAEQKVTGQQHFVYAEHRNGDVTGPYSAADFERLYA